MINIKEEFTKEINETKDINKIEDKIKYISFKLTKNKISRLKDNKKIEQRINELLKSYTKILKDENVENISTILSVIEGITKAASEEKENSIYRKIVQIGKLEKEIEEEKQELRNLLRNIYINMETAAKVLDKNTQDFVQKAINDTKLKDVVLLGILKETTEEAMLTVLENKKDIEVLINQITQNIVYQSVEEGDISKAKIIEVSRIVLNVAIDIADEYQAVAKEILKGTTYGIKEAVVKAINKFNENLEFLPDETRDTRQEQILFEGLNIIDVNSDFLDLLRNSAKGSKGISKNILEDIIFEIDSPFSKIVKITADTKEGVLKKIERLKDNPKINEFKKRLTQKITDLNLEQKLKKIKNEDSLNTSKESKKLGTRAWEIAKNALESAVKGTKETLKKIDKDEDSLKK